MAQDWDTKLRYYMYIYKSQFFSDTQFSSKPNYIFIQRKAQLSCDI
jgi:hypothetical protein